MKRLLKALLKLVVGLAILAVLVFAGAYFTLRRPPPPDGTSGPEADAAAHAVEKAANVEAWNATGAVRFTAFGHHHLWDRKRNLARVEWGGHKVILDVGKKTGVAWTDGKLVEGKASDELVDKAWKLHLNDGFWLNPLGKLFDAGVTRALADVDGKQALIIRYSSGGATPGDAYVWFLGDDGLPNRWRMYAHILPIPGLEATWEDWTLLTTGAKVSARHKIAGFDAVRMEDLEAARSLAELVPEDPFVALTKR